MHTIYKYIVEERASSQFFQPSLFKGFRAQGFQGLVVYIGSRHCFIAKTCEGDPGGGAPDHRVLLRAHEGHGRRNRKPGRAVRRSEGTAVGPIPETKVDDRYRFAGL